MIDIGCDCVRVVISSKVFGNPQELWQGAVAQEHRRRHDAIRIASEGFAAIAHRLICSRGFSDVQSSSRHLCRQPQPTESTMRQLYRNYLPRLLRISANLHPLKVFQGRSSFYGPSTAHIPTLERDLIPPIYLAIHHEAYAN